MAKIRLHHAILITWLAFGAICLIWPSLLAQMASFSSKLFSSSPSSSSSTFSSSSLFDPSSSSASFSRVAVVDYIESAIVEQRNFIKQSQNEVQKELTTAKDKLERLEKRISWINGPTQTESVTLAHYRDVAGRLERIMHHMNQALELVNERDRAISPVFSELAFSEARDLFVRQQSVYSSSSWTLFKFDVFWNALFGRRNEDVTAYLIQLAGMLVWRLTVGIVIGVFDFLIRLPFYLFEYGTLDLASMSSASLLLVAASIDESSAAINLITQGELERHRERYIEMAKKTEEREGEREEEKEESGNANTEGERSSSSTSKSKRRDSSSSSSSSSSSVSDDDDGSLESYERNKRAREAEEKADKEYRIEHSDDEKRYEYKYDSNSDNDIKVEDEYKRDTRYEEEQQQRKPQQTEEKPSREKQREREKQSDEVIDEEYEWERNVNKIMAQVNRIKMNISGVKSWSSQWCRVLFWLIWVAAAALGAGIILACVWIPLIFCVVMLARNRQQR